MAKITNLVEIKRKQDDFSSDIKRTRISSFPPEFGGVINELTHWYV